MGDFLPEAEVDGCGLVKVGPDDAVDDEFGIAVMDAHGNAFSVRDDGAADTK